MLQKQLQEKEEASKQQQQQPIAASKPATKGKTITAAGMVCMIAVI